jgi:peptidyl-prolyl cis-trans isomerase B (cyclophilin B)
VTVRFTGGDPTIGAMLKRATLALAAAAALASLAACGGGSSSSASDQGGSGGKPSGTSAPASVTCSYPTSGTASKQATVPPSQPTVGGTVAATIQTTEGPVAITLDAAHAPCTVNSFVSLATQGYFDNTPCHRLTTSGIHVLQCGDPSGTGSGGPGYSFKDETTGHDTYPTGTLAMANAGPNTNGSQFFLCYGDCSSLDSQPDYTVFGTIGADGLATLKKVADAGEDDANGPGDGHPKDGVKITGITWG